MVFYGDDIDGCETTTSASYGVEVVWKKGTLNDLWFGGLLLYVDDSTTQTTLPLRAI